MPAARIFSLTSTLPNWTQFLSVTQQIFNRSMTAELDKREKFNNDLPSFVHCLSEARFAGNKDFSQSLKHIYYTFLIAGTLDDFCDFIDSGLAVTVTDNGNVALVSGSLRDWKSTIVDLGGQKYRDDLKPLCVELLNYFVNNCGLAEFFNDVKIAENLKTKVLYLERK